MKKWDETTSGEIMNAISVLVAMLISRVSQTGKILREWPLPPRGKNNFVVDFDYCENWKMDWLLLISFYSVWQMV